MPNTTKEFDRALALCALSQCASLVHRLASQGQIPTAHYSIMRDSLFKFDVENTEEIYQRYSFADLEEGQRPEVIAPQLSQNLSMGLKACSEIFTEGASHKHPNTIRYVMALIQLEKHFHKSSQMMDKVHSALVNIKKQQHVGTTGLEEKSENSAEDNVQNNLENNLENKAESDAKTDAALSALYLATLAKLPFRIQVLGKMQHLQNTENEHCVRVLLFSGIRAAMLWRQSGGRRWHFLLAKGNIRKGLKLVRAA